MLVTLTEMKIQSSVSVFKGITLDGGPTSHVMKKVVVTNTSNDSNRVSVEDIRKKTDKTTLFVTTANRQRVRAPRSTGILKCEWGKSHWGFSWGY
jgi:hypothetical protein